MSAGRVARALQAAARGLQARGFAASANGGGFYEVRKYTLHPEGQKAFLALSETFAPMRRELIPGFLGMFAAETGGVLNEVIHFYYYPDYASRDKVREKLAGHKVWQQNYVDISRRFVQKQESMIVLEASDCHKAAGVGSAADFRTAPRGAGAPAVYELRKYQLSLGYNPVPALRKEFVKGLPSKVQLMAQGQLVLMCYSDFGELNQVFELWRFDSMGSCIAARESARGAAEWRTCIAAVAPMVQSFSTSVLAPVSFSPWQ